jgi:hypothetical protein
VFIAGVAGIFAGAVHVLSGPDHLAAIAPMASDGRRRTWTAGALWGLGHSSGVLIVGLLALLFKDWLPVDALSSWSERIVGVVLLAIGAWGLHRALRTRVHTHPHTHGDLTHAHVHAHGFHQHATPQNAQGEVPRSSGHAAALHTHTHAAFAVGILHGLAGSSHFLAVLPALALPGMDASLGYLTGYGVGTVAAMSGFASAIGFIAARAQRTGGPGASRWLLSGCSVAAMLVGIAWLSL